MADPNYFIVWNADRTEGFITDDQNDALTAAGNRQVNYESTLGATFREQYEDQKRTVQPVTIHPELSARAKALLTRVERGDFYTTQSDRTPKAMQELIDHGLVGTMGRVVELKRCYVALGHTPFVMDKAPGEPE